MSDRYKGYRKAKASILIKDREKYSNIIAVIFCITIGVVLMLNLIVKDRKFSPEENRVLQTEPNFTISHYLDGRLESEIDAYSNDQFFARKGAVRVKTSADVSMGVLEANGVYRCKDNYLMEDISSPNRKYVDNSLSAIKEFKERYNNIGMSFILAPNTANILSDKLPNAVKLSNQNKYMDDFFSKLSATGVKTVDVRKPLIEASKKRQIYYRTDHHWTSDGAYVAYSKLASDLGMDNKVKYKPVIVKNDFIGTLSSKSGFTGGKYDSIKVFLPEKNSGYKPSLIYYPETKEKTTNFYRLNNLNKKDAYTVFGGSNHPVYKIETPVTPAENLLLIKDSYANSMIPFLSQNFRKIVVVDPRYYYDDIDDLISAEGITQVMFLYNANTFFEDNSLSLTLTK